MKYILCEKTVGELLECIRDQSTETFFYVYHHDYMDMTPTQRALQQQNRYITHRQISMHLSPYEISTLLEDIVYEMVKEQYNGDFKSELKRRLLDQKVITTADIDAYSVNFNCGYKTNIKHNDYLTDIVSFEEELKKSTFPISRLNNDVKLYVEHVTVISTLYQTRYMAAAIDREINRRAKSLTFCLKNDRLIIPKEYAVRGKAGISAWQEYKRSRSSMNTMEKRVMRKLINDKKIAMKGVFSALINDVSYPLQDYTLPQICVDGARNSAKKDKLINKLLADKTQQEIMNLTVTEMRRLIRDFFVEQFNIATEKMDKEVDM